MDFCIYSEHNYRHERETECGDSGASSGSSGSGVSTGIVVVLMVAGAIVTEVAAIVTVRAILLLEDCGRLT